MTKDKSDHSLRTSKTMLEELGILLQKASKSLAALNGPDIEASVQAIDKWHHEFSGHASLFSKDDLKVVREKFLQYKRLCQFGNDVMNQAFSRIGTNNDSEVRRYEHSGKIEEHDTSVGVHQIG